MGHFKSKRILEALLCPICRSDMVIFAESGSVFCRGGRRHCFDLSASGYVNLALPSQSGGGDSKSAVRARSEFLEKGYYSPIAEEIIKILEKYKGNNALIIDAGCGEGYYSSKIAEKGYSVFGIDISKFAVDHAAKRCQRQDIAEASFAVASVFDIPVHDLAADAVVNIFAPCAEGEYRRVLSDDGILLVAYAGKDHLMGLKKAIYTDAYANDGRADMPERMTLIEEVSVRFDISLDKNEDIMNLFSMTPYYWRTSPSDVEKLRGVDTLVTEVDVVIAVYKKSTFKEKTV